MVILYTPWVMPIFMIISIDQATIQLTREPKKLPILEINKKVKSINEYKFNDFKLIDYNPHNHIKAEVVIVKEPTISLMVAFDQNYLIGNKNTILGIYLENLRILEP